MLTIYNESNKPFEVAVRDKKENKDHQRVIITKNNFFFNSFLNDKDKDSLVNNVQKAVNGNVAFVDVTNPRMSFDNRTQDPLLIANSNNGSSIFLLANLDLEEDEKIIDMQSSKEVFILNNRINKYDNISFTASFKSGPETELVIARFKKSTPNEIKITKFLHDGKGHFTVVTTINPRETYTQRDTNHSFKIKPYRPYRPTFLIFTEEKNYDKCKKAYGNKNYHIETFSNIEDLQKKIAEWREKKFRAATLFVDKPQTQKCTREENIAMNEIRKAFNKALLLHNNRYIKIMTDYKRGYTAAKQKEEKKAQAAPKRQEPPKRLVSAEAVVRGGQNFTDDSDLPPRLRGKKKNEPSKKAKPSKTKK